MSSELKILYSLPSSLISVPPYLLTSTRSPFLTSNGIFFPSSLVLPVPSATMTLSIGFSLAVSGMMMPPFLTSFSSTASTRMRSPRGLTFSAILLVWFCCLFLFNQKPAAPAEGKLFPLQSPKRPYRRGHRLTDEKAFRVVHYIRTSEWLPTGLQRPGHRVVQILVGRTLHGLISFDIVSHLLSF